MRASALPPPALAAETVSVRYRRPGRASIQALDGVSLSLRRGEMVGLIGESGSGKSTLAKTLLGLLRPDEGRVLSDGADIATFDSAARRLFRRRVQMVFQDAAGSLNPRFTAGAALREALSVHGICPRSTLDARVAGLLREVGLPEETAGQTPRELSGGQCQRVSIARALAVEPQILIADEPVSALDVSVQARILNLLSDLRDRLGLAVLLIAHDLAVVRAVCDRVHVLWQGRILESGPPDDVLRHPSHPQVRALLDAAPDVDRALQARGASA
jgi:peptide/nickel transport system ATP-binding protein